MRADSCRVSRLFIKRGLQRHLEPNPAHHPGNAPTHLTFLYVTVSTLKPTVGIVVTDWFSLSLYRMAVRAPGKGASASSFTPNLQPVQVPPRVRARLKKPPSRTIERERNALVFPAASSPNIKIRISLLPKSLPARVHGRRADSEKTRRREGFRRGGVSASRWSRRRREGVGAGAIDSGESREHVERVSKFRNAVHCSRRRREERERTQRFRQPRSPAGKCRTGQRVCQSVSGAVPCVSTHILSESWRVEARSCG